jgi:ABC-type glycerol-3-phosphate transport system substrate-binding protein
MTGQVTRRRLVALGGRVAGAAGASWLAACGAGAGSGGTNALPQGKQVTLLHWGGLPETHPSGAAHYGTINEHADELRSTIGVTIQSDYADTEKILVAAAGGTPPNTAWIGYEDGARLFVRQTVVDPDEELKRVKEWAAQRKDIFTGMLESSMWGGKLTAIPTDTSTRGVYYDKAVLTKAGVTAPGLTWTRDEFVQKVTRASAPPDRWGFTFSPSWLDFMVFLGTAGGSLMNKEQTKFTIDNQVGKETLQFMYDLAYKQQAVPTPPAGEMMRKAEGKVAFDMSGNFRLPTLRKAGLDVGSVAIPSQKARFTQADGWNVAIFKARDAAVQQASARFAMWLNSTTFQVPFLIKSDNVPVSKAALEHKDFQAYLAKDPVVKVFSDQAPYAYRAPTAPSGRKAEDTISTYLKKALGNEMSLNDALTQAQREAQLILDDDLRQSGR